MLTGLRYRRQLYEVSTGRMRDWDPLWILIRLERYYCLWKAISDISETSQRILEARILEKLSLRAIAQELNLTQREVKTRYEAACNVVRDALPALLHGESRVLKCRNPNYSCRKECTKYAQR